MKKDFNDSASLLSHADEAGLRMPLLRQVEKDFRRAGLQREASKSIAEGAEQWSDAEILEHWKIAIYRLLMERFDSYLNLMYAADVPEAAFEGIHPEDPVAAATDILFILLRREWQKVSFRASSDRNKTNQK